MLVAAVRIMLSVCRWTLGVTKLRLHNFLRMSKSRHYFRLFKGSFIASSGGRIRSQMIYIVGYSFILGGLLLHYHLLYSLFHDLLKLILLSLLLYLLFSQLWNSFHGLFKNELLWILLKDVAWVVWELRWWQRRNYRTVQNLSSLGCQNSWKPYFSDSLLFIWWWGTGSWDCDISKLILIVL